MLLRMVKERPLPPLASVETLRLVRRGRALAIRPNRRREGREAEDGWLCSLERGRRLGLYLAGEERTKKGTSIPASKWEGAGAEVESIVKSKQK
jgi:hypothetical protein